MHFRSLLLVLLLFLAACGDEPTLIAGDVGADDSADADTDDTQAGSGDRGSVADDSAPIALSPSTTAPWNVTLADNPLLQLMHETETDAQIGSTWFVLVDDEANSIASGSDDFPHFVVRLDAWFGVENDIEFTISTTNATIADERPSKLQCGNNFAGFAATDSARFERRPNTLPEVLGTTLAWASEGCAEATEIAYDELFDGEVELEVTATGFLLTKPDALAQTYRFEMLAPLPQRSTGTPPPAVTTTSVAGVTTTSGGPVADGGES